ncbi:hypothetical protein KA005_29075 [bacterium]|nr:hypothetical protein [bacterium]
MMLKQARKGYKKMIDENRQVLIVTIPGDPTDPWSAETTKDFTGRIAHEQRGPSDLEVGTAGLSTNLSRFLSVEYDVDFLAVGQIITDQNSKDWKLGAVDPLSKFGGIHGYQVPLEEAV